MQLSNEHFVWVRLSNPQLLKWHSGNTDELLKEAEAVIKHSKDMNTRIMAQIVVRKHLLYNKKLSFSKKQQLVDRIFGKSARKTLLSPSRTL